ncbi:hypothetical protein [Sphingopyxis soli]|uniref:hypothetical protein n=1 Tax=Sphingopyxis soli TaxID=592051 RepID=UPI001BFE3161|nr:hypothetical protein [Sphingopyxis soli]
MYKDEWAGSELARAEYTFLDRQADIDAEVQKKFPTANAPKASPTLGSPIRKGKPLDPAILTRFKEAAERRAAESSAFAAEVMKRLPPLAELAALNDARKARLIEAKSALFGAIINSRVPAFWYADGSANDPRRVPDGELVKDWNTVGGNLRRRGYIWRERAAWYVYVDAAALADAFPLNPLRETTVGSIPLESLSPYLRLMIEVSLQEGVTSDTRTKPEVLGDILRREAPKFGLTSGAGNDGSDITETWAKSLAKALRWPEARKGRAEPGSTRKR